MGFLHLGPSVLFFSLGCWYAICLCYDVIPNFGLMSYYKEIGSARKRVGSALSEAVNTKGGDKREHG